MRMVIGCGMSTWWHNLHPHLSMKPAEKRQLPSSSAVSGIMSLTFVCDPQESLIHPTKTKTTTRSRSNHQPLSSAKWLRELTTNVTLGQFHRKITRYSSPLCISFLFEMFKELSDYRWLPLPRRWRCSCNRLVSDILCHEITSKSV